MLRCPTAPAALRIQAVLSLLSRTEPAEALCRRLRVCSPCLEKWADAFLAHALQGLTSAGAPVDRYEVLAKEADALARGLDETRTELEVWERLVRRAASN
ncbi:MULTISPECIES: hypothetical protein [unclassified Streptomyces]|uniref:hypothetical protein n=1 Tax=unclassified Streptomyces TaxID=2593676 RepID=UPI002E1055B1|nr:MULTISPECIES: hypothetical protein [unclassified Streptomyces]WSR29089.1 hypothetical protein OG573_41620 [Streptomyces sp. NBC_01205]